MTLQTVPSLWCVCLLAISVAETGSQLQGHEERKRERRDRKDESERMNNNVIMITVIVLFIIFNSHD